METLLMNVDEAAKSLCISRSLLYDLMGEGKIGYLKIGTRTLFERAEIDRFIAAHRLHASEAGLYLDAYTAALDG